MHQIIAIPGHLSCTKVQTLLCHCDGVVQFPQTLYIAMKIHERYTTRDMAHEQLGRSVTGLSISHHSMYTGNHLFTLLQESHITMHPSHPGQYNGHALTNGLHANTPSFCTQLEKSEGHIYM